MFGETYSLSLITEFLNSKGIPYEYCNARVGILFDNHGCRVQLSDIYTLSVQTHPDVAGDSFAEVALQNIVTQKL
jgi:aspartokinase